MGQNEPKVPLIHKILHLLMPDVSVPSLEPREPKPPRKAVTDRPTLYEYGYYACLDIGAFTRYVFGQGGRLFVIWFEPAAQWIRQKWEQAVSRYLRRAKKERRQIRRGFSTARELLKEASGKSFWQILRQLPGIAWRRHGRYISLIAQAVMLVAATAVLLLTVRYWANTTFALELTYDGAHIGYVEDEAVLKTALTLAQERMAQAKELSDSHASLVLRAAQQDNVLSEYEVCDELLRTCTVGVKSMCGLYVDGKLEGVLENRSDMERLLRDVLQASAGDAVTSNEKAEFMGDVEAVDGMYPAFSADDYESLKNRLMSPDENGNLHLKVQIRCTETYEEPVPYGSVTFNDKSKYVGYSEVRVAGVDGVKRVTADVIYLNGAEQRREIKEEKVLKKPVTEVVAVGSYHANRNAKAGVATGSFMWPLPSCHTIYSGYGYRSGKFHAGVDISGNGVMGKEILASDGGTVREVNTEGWGGGYGLYVIVDHGNGYASVYCHCSEILVTAGQRVAQGELIARVGDTGDSFGAHLHFEIRINGSSVDPTPYLQ